MSMVWPVVDAKNELFALKIGRPEVGSRAEPDALRTWTDPSIERLKTEDEVFGLLLQRLDGNRSSEDHPNIDEACTVIDIIPTSPTSVSTAAGIPPLDHEALRIAESIAMGTLRLMYAARVMAFSNLFVVTNSLRIK